MNVPIAFDIHMYHDFLDFWNEHDRDLSKGFQSVCWCCLPPRKLGDGPRLLNPKGDRALAVGAIGEADTDRLLHGREELLADEAFRCRVGLRLWEVADAAPHNDGEDLTYKYRHHPGGRGKFWQERRQKRLQRLERYARRVAALRATGLDIAMPAQPPATGPYAPPTPPASTGSRRTRLSRDEYYALLDFWDCHDHDLAEAIRTIELRCAETWDTPDDVMPAYSLRRHCAYLAKVLGRRAVTRLFWRWEEALADEAFRYEVGAKLWETVDTAPETPTMTLYRGHVPNLYAEETKAWEQKRVPRQRRYALRERALLDAQAEGALAAEGVPAT